MNEEEYAKWKERIVIILKMDNESEDFISFLIKWFDSELQGSTEMELLQEFHPVLKNSSEEDIYDFMNKARFFVEGMSREDFKRQIFDSAFFLYRPCLKAKYEKMITENLEGWFEDNNIQSKISFVNEEISIKLADKEKDGILVFEILKNSMVKNPVLKNDTIFVPITNIEHCWID